MKWWDELNIIFKILTSGNIAFIYDEKMKSVSNLYFN